MDHHSQGVIFAVVSILAALLLSIAPLSVGAMWLRPDWLMLVLIFWLLAMPESLGVALCWLAGLVQDVLQGAVLGQNAFSLAVVAYVVQVSYQQMRMFSLRKQAALIAVLELFRVLIDQWAQNLNGVSHTDWRVFLPVLTTALMWFLVRPIMSWLQRLFVAY